MLPTGRPWFAVLARSFREEIRAGALQAAVAVALVLTVISVLLPPVFWDQARTTIEALRGADVTLLVAAIAFSGQGRAGTRPARQNPLSALAEITAIIAGEAVAVGAASLLLTVAQALSACFFLTVSTTTPLTAMGYVPMLGSTLGVVVVAAAWSTVWRWTAGSRAAPWLTLVGFAVATWLETRAIPPGLLPPLQRCLSPLAAGEGEAWLLALLGCVLHALAIAALAAVAFPRHATRSLEN